MPGTLRQRKGDKGGPGGAEEAPGADGGDGGRKGESKLPERPPVPRTPVDYGTDWAAWLIGVGNVVAAGGLAMLAAAQFSHKYLDFGGGVVRPWGVDFVVEGLSGRDGAALWNGFWAALYSVASVLCLCAATNAAAIPQWVDARVALEFVEGSRAGTPPALAPRWLRLAFGAIGVIFAVLMVSLGPQVGTKSADKLEELMMGVPINFAETKHVIASVVAIAEGRALLVMLVASIWFLCHCAFWELSPVSAMMEVDSRAVRGEQQRAGSTIVSRSRSSAWAGVVVLGGAVVVLAAGWCGYEGCMRPT